MAWLQIEPKNKLNSKPVGNTFARLKMVQYNYYVLLGSNMGKREEMLNNAMVDIGRIAKIICHSSIYETAAWGKEDQQAFLNQVLQVQTLTKPQQFLKQLLEIERKLGRVREEKWAERTIDIDILLCDQLVIEEENLSIPHPSLHLRRFTLEPLVEIANDVLHPILKKTLQEILRDCDDPLPVTKLASA